MFLLKRKKYSQDLKALLSSLSAELHILKSGFLKVKEVDGNTIPNWEERCENTVNVFCSCFHKKYFPLDDEIRDSIPEALSTLQKDVSSTGGACWLDKHKQNLILVSLKVEFGNAGKEVYQCFEKVRRFAKRTFRMEESILELVRKDLPTLKEALKSCNITLNKKTLVVVCLRNEVDNVAEKVESFLQRLREVKSNGISKINLVYTIANLISDPLSILLHRWRVEFTRYFSGTFLLLIRLAFFWSFQNYFVAYLYLISDSIELYHRQPKIDVESLILMIENVLVSILFNLTRATLLSLHNHINITVIYVLLYR